MLILRTLIRILPEDVIIPYNNYFKILMKLAHNSFFMASLNEINSGIKQRMKVMVPGRDKCGNSYDKVFITSVSEIKSIRNFRNQENVFTLSA